MLRCFIASLSAHMQQAVETLYRALLSATWPLENQTDSMHVLLPAEAHHFSRFGWEAIV